MALNTILKICAVLIVQCVAQAYYDPFADNVLFSVTWPGPIEVQLSDLTGSDQQNAGSEDDSLVITTKDKEQYKCVFPQVLKNNHEHEVDSYRGPDELALLKPLFSQTSCSYRIESYWTYELCHGRFLRQYHEEKEPGKKATLQEYYLGHYKPQTTSESQPPPVEEPPSDTKEAKSKEKVPLQKVEGIEIPYFAVNFTEGTKCDLTEKSRRVSIHYVCQEEGKGEVYALKETSTCEYEVVVLTSLLCAHPGYKLRKEPVNEIQCHPLTGSPRRPRGLDNLELESTAGRFNQPEDDEEDDLDKDEQVSERQKGDRVLPDEPEERQEQKPTTYHQRPAANIGTNTDKQMLTQFLNGDYCIQGGSGWWKHEFCYGKYVTQFHEEASGKTVILLGHWNKEQHIKWIKANPAKLPKPVGQRKGIIHFYGMGDKCDLTGKNRAVEVKLKCKDKQNQPHAVAIYLVEPSPCEYSLVVESPILCPLIDQADDLGLIEQS